MTALIARLVGWMIPRRPYWLVIVRGPGGISFALPQKFPSFGEARVAKLVHELVDIDEKYEFEIRRVR